MNNRFLSLVFRSQVGFAIAICCLLLGTARADVVPFLTGSFDIANAAAIGGNAFGTVLGGNYLVAQGTVLNYYEDPPCFVADCNQQYWGDVHGGPIVFDAHVWNGNDSESYSFVGTITDGHFQGVNHLGNFAFDTFTYESINPGFTGVWDNGWTSTGSLTAEWQYGPDFIWFQTGGMSLVTYSRVPERATLALMGSGMLRVAGVLRRRQRAQKPPSSSRR